MATITFDTRKAVRKLQAAGFPEPLADGIVDTVAEAFTDTVATKTDIAGVKIDIGGPEGGVRRPEGGVRGSQGRARRRESGSQDHQVLLRTGDYPPTAQDRLLLILVQAVASNTTLLRNGHGTEQRGTPTPLSGTPQGRTAAVPRALPRPEGQAVQGAALERRGAGAGRPPG